MTSLTWERGRKNTDDHRETARPHKHPHKHPHTRNRDSHGGTYGERHTKARLLPEGVIGERHTNLRDGHLLAADTYTHAQPMKRHTRTDRPRSGTTEGSTGAIAVHTRDGADPAGPADVGKGVALGRVVNGDLREVLEGARGIPVQRADLTREVAREGQMSPLQSMSTRKRDFDIFVVPE